MKIPTQTRGVSRTMAVTHVPVSGLAPQFLGKLFRKAGKAVRPVVRAPVGLLAEGAHNQFGDLPTTAARVWPVALAGNQSAMPDPVIEDNSLGAGGGYAATDGDEYPCGTCANGNVMWCDEAGNSYGCWD